ncbi:MAG TPA: Trm112 family protein [Acidobacteriaceae bacterium]|nr:Trm112 family protein [Acidobacteriaceae bacterium]
MVIAAVYTRWLYTLERVKKPAIDEIALRLLVCPICHATLSSLDQDSVRCTGCERRYPIRDGLPVLLADAARQ